MISDIASLWTLALVVGIVILGLIFRKPIAMRIERGGVKVKRKDLSVEIERHEEPLPAGQAEDRRRSDDQETARNPDHGNEEETVDVPAETEADGESESGDAEPTYWDVIGKLRTGNVEEAEALFDRVVGRDALDSAGNHRNDALFAFMRSQWGNDADALDELRTLSALPELGGYGHNLLAQVYEDNELFEKALESYETGLALSKDSREKSAAITGAARSEHALGTLDGALGRLGAALAEATDDDERRLYYAAFASVFQKEKDWLARAFALEKLIELRPGDLSRRFDAAYCYSEAGEHRLAALHYRALLAAKPDHATARNNLGVDYERLSLPIQAASTYKRSAELRESLAAANLANVYVNAGLAAEARAILEDAGGWEDVHQNVSSNMARLNEKEENEKSTLELVLDQARRDQRFARYFAEARYVTATLPDLGVVWEDESGDLRFEVSQTGLVFEAAFRESDKSKKLQGTLSNRAFEFDLLVETYSLSLSKMAYEKRGSGRGYVDESRCVHLKFKEGVDERTLDGLRLATTEHVN